MSTSQLNETLKSEQWNLLSIVRENWCNNQERLIKRMKYAFIIYGLTFFFVFVMEQDKEIFVTLPEIGKLDHDFRPYINLVLIMLAGESLFETTMLIKMRVNYTNRIQQLIEDNDFYKEFLEVDILPSSTHLLDLRIKDNSKIANRSTVDNTGIVGKLNTNFLMFLLFSFATKNFIYSLLVLSTDKSSINNWFVFALNIFIFSYSITVLKKVYNYNKNGIFIK